MDRRSAAKAPVSPVARILVHEETLDPSFLPPRLVLGEKELELTLRRYREALG